MAVLLLLAVRAEAQGDGATTGTAQRIVSLAPNLTEGLFALGLGDRVVGVTDFCRYPEEAKSKTSVGTLFTPSVERLYALKPDLVVHVPSHEPLARRLSGMGIRTLSVPSETIGDIKAGLLAMGRETGTAARAEELVQEIDAALQRTSRLYEGMPTVLLVVGYSPAGLKDIYAAGPGTFLDEMIVAAGSTNWLAGTHVRYPTVARESMRARPPDVILDANESPTKGRTAAERAQLERRWHEFLGTKKTRIIFVDDPHLTIPGPGVADAVATLNGLIHPVAPPPAPTAR